MKKGKEEKAEKGGISSKRRKGGTGEGRRGRERGGEVWVWGKTAAFYINCYQLS